MGRDKGVKNQSGGPNSPRLANRNIAWGSVLKYHLLPIIAGQRAPNTIRGLMYILKAKGVLAKSDYSTLDKHLVEWRLDNKIDWDDIADGSGRGLVGNFGHFQDVEKWINNKLDPLKNAAVEYRNLLGKQWRWFAQPNYVEFMCEKDAITPTVHAYIKDRYVKISANRGNNGWGWAHVYSQLLSSELQYFDLETKKWKPRTVYLWYLGDDDSYGRRMDRLIREQLKMFGILDRINFKRIAVLPEQIAEFGLPRSDEGGGFDIDALNAYNEDLFEKLLIDHIDPHFDEKIHKKVLEMYSVEYIDSLIKKWVKFPEDKDKGVSSTRNGR